MAQIAVSSVFRYSCRGFSACPMPSVDISCPMEAVYAKAKVQSENKFPKLKLGDHVVNFLTPQEITQMLDQPIQKTLKAKIPVSGIAPVAEENEIIEDWQQAFNFNNYGMINDFIRNFLAKKHPELGRKGAVCPFVPVSLRKDTLYMSVIRINESPAAEIEEFLKAFAPTFDKMEPNTGLARQFKAVVFIFPDIPLEKTSECIDQVQEAVKPFYVTRGLMVGEFHMRNNQPGLRNDDFFPLRTPIPCIAVRHMVPSDLAFLNIEKYALNIRISFLTSFLKIFGGETGGKRRKIEQAQVALDEALEEQSIFLNETRVSDTKLAQQKHN